MIRDTLTGRYDADAIARLTWPVAWNVTMPAEARAEEEESLAAFVAEARECLDSHPDAVAVEVKAGEILSVELSEDAVV